MSWHGAEKRKQKEKGTHLAFWMRNVPFGKHIWILGPQLVALFRKVLEPCGDEASLEKVDHWGHALRFYSLTPLPVHSASCPLSDSCPQKTEVTSKQPQPPTLIAREMPATILSLLRPYIYHTQTLPSRSFLLGISLQGEKDLNSIQDPHQVAMLQDQSPFPSHSLLTETAREVWGKWTQWHCYLRFPPSGMCGRQQPYWPSHPRFGILFCSPWQMNRAGD